MNRRPVRCGCSRCKLYCSPSSTLGDLDYNSEAPFARVDFEDRQYQTALIEYAKRQNVLACLPTGSGKTFIALKLIEHYKKDILEDGKKVFFLANTIPLVNQQAAFIARNSAYKVKHLTGDLGVDYWGQSTWNEIIETYHVLAMTVQIFVNMLNHGYIGFSKISLLIFDECHHAVGGHPMAMVMKEYSRTVELKPSYTLPRILGLSATIINGMCKPLQVPTKIQEMEGTMLSTAITYKDYEEVLAHSTHSTIQRVVFNPDFQNHIFIMNASEMKELSEKLGVFRKERKQKKLGAAKITPGCLDPRLSTFDNVYNLMLIKPTPGDLKVAVDDVLFCYENLGLYCTKIALNLRLAFIEFSLMDLQDGETKSWYIRIQNLFRDFVTNVDKEMAWQESDPKKYVTRYISPQIQSLLDILKNYRNHETGPVCEFNDKRLCGVVFTDRRATAQVLAWYLMDLAKDNEKDWGFIRPNFVVGTSRTAFESVETRVYAKKQTEVLNKFRLKDLNLLVATSVLEEGIDVPSCNFIVRFDPVKTYTSFIQSMGRARKKGATFYAMLPLETFAKGSAKLDEFQEIYKRIVDHLRKNVEKIDADRNGSQIVSIWEKDLIPPICPGGTPESPKITMDSAADVVDRYCMLLPSDGISGLQSLSWWTEVGPGRGFNAHVKLPLNGAIKHTVEGQTMRNKELAKQAAYMEVARLLLEAGCFDDKLIPTHPTLPIPVEKFFKDFVPFGNPAAGETPEETTEAANMHGPAESPEKIKEDMLKRRTKWYSKLLPKIITTSSVSPDKYYAYRIEFNLVEQRGNCPWKRLYKLDDVKEGLAIVTSHRLPAIPQFPLFGTFGTIHSSLVQIPTKTWRCDGKILSSWKFIQHKIFAEVLGLKHPLLEHSEQLGLLIVPIKKVKDIWEFYDTVEGHINEMNAIQKTKPPAPTRDRSIPRGRGFQHNQGRDNDRGRRFQVQQPPTSNLHNNAVVFPYYKTPKPAYLVDCVSDHNALMEFDGGTYKNYIENQYSTRRATIRIQDPSKNLLTCKFAGIAIGRMQKDPIQLNYLLEKFSKEDEFPVYMVPELVYSVSIPASFVVQCKLLPSVLHRVTRLLMAQEVVAECSEKVGWPGKRPLPMEPEDLSSFSSAHESKKKEEEERRKRVLELREEKLRLNKRKPCPKNKQINIEQRELHYEFIHPNQIKPEDIKLFHEAVSVQHSAKKLTTEFELVENSNLSLDSKIPLMDISKLELESLEKPLSLLNNGPSLLLIMEALSLKISNDGLMVGRFAKIGASFLNFASSSFAYFNYPTYGEPLLCQLRNKMLALDYVLALATKAKLAELLSGSQFWPGASWIPPGKRVLHNAGDMLATNNLQLNVLDELFTAKKNEQPKIQGMSKTELQQFIERKGILAFAGTEAQRDKEKMKNAPFSVKNATFTHANLTDFDIVEGFQALVGAFFQSNGVQGGYKSLEWLGFQGPDKDGKSQTLKSAGKHSNTFANSADLSTLFAQMKPLEKKIEYEFKDKTLLIQAFTHPTYPAHNLPECYQRLEFLGDSILELLLTTHLYSLPSNGMSSDDLHNISTALINPVTYASLSVRYGLHKYLLSMCKSLTDMIDNFVVYQESVEHHVVGHFTLVTDEECRGPKHVEVPKALCDIWESLAGAIFLDSGNSLDAVWKVFYRLMQPEIDTFWEKKYQAPIFELRDLMKKEKIEVKYRRFTGKKMEARGREVVQVELGPYGKYFGSGTTRSRAREAAAKVALKLIKEENLFIQKLNNAKTIMLLNC